MDPADDPWASWTLVAMAAAVSACVAVSASVALAKPPGEGAVRAASISPRTVGDYLLPRQRRANVLNPALVLSALALSVAVQRDDAGPSWLVPGVAIASLVVLVTWLTQRFVVTRPRRAVSEDDVFWHEHLLASTMPLLPRVAGFVSIVTTAGVVWPALEEGKTPLVVLGGTALFLAGCAVLALFIPRDGEDGQTVPALEGLTFAR